MHMTRRARRATWRRVRSYRWHLPLTSCSKWKIASCPWCIVVWGLRYFNHKLGTVWELLEANRGTNCERLSFFFSLGWAGEGPFIYVFSFQSKCIYNFTSMTLFHGFCNLESWCEPTTFNQQPLSSHLCPIYSFSDSNSCLFKKQQQKKNIQKL